MDGIGGKTSRIWMRGQQHNTALSRASYRDYAIVESEITKRNFESNERPIIKLPSHWHSVMFSATSTVVDTIEVWGPKISLMIRFKRHKCKQTPHVVDTCLCARAQIFSAHAPPNEGNHQGLLHVVCTRFRECGPTCGFIVDVTLHVHSQRVHQISVWTCQYTVTIGWYFQKLQSRVYSMTQKLY